ncbi:MAG: hypothetical protein PHG80_11605 [Methanoregulaceae archaeon]|nr:hypothetical protein [Methanoregulaceae archaeon]
MSNETSEFNCPACGEILTTHPRYTFDFLKCKCGAFYTRDRGSDDLLVLTQYEVQEETKALRWRIYRLYDLRTGADVVARRTYNEWLDAYEFFDPADAKLVRKELAGMEYKSRGEVWLKAPPERWRGMIGER